MCPELRIQWLLKRNSELRWLFRAAILRVTGDQQMRVMEEIVQMPRTPSTGDGRSSANLG